MNRWKKDKWLIERMNKRISEWINIKMDKWIIEWLNGRLKERINEPIKKWMNKRMME